MGVESFSSDSSQAISFMTGWAKSNEVGCVLSTILVNLSQRVQINRKNAPAGRYPTSEARLGKHFES